MKCWPNCCSGAGWRTWKLCLHWPANLPCFLATIIEEIIMKYTNSHIKVLISLAAATLLATACNRQTTTTKPDDVDYYTCTMHPSVRSQDPNGKCPICGMGLVPVKKKSGAAGDSAETGMNNMPGMGGG